MRFILRIVAAAGLILILAAGGAFAQTMMQVPGAGQNAPSFSPRAQSTATPRLPEGATLQIAPALTPAPQASAPPPPSAPPSAAPSVAAPPPMMTQSAPVLPAVFRGCWQGEVDLLDTLERLPGGHKVGYWTPKTYKLCYKRIGDGPFKLTFSETGIAPTEKIIHARGRVDTLATDGRVYARLRSQLGFDEFRVEPGEGQTFHVDETTMLDCRIQNGAMAVAASVYGTRDGAPWFRARWRALFRPVAQ
ncbi:MAG: hypothetical protein WA740_12790 [Candidatus Binataceae bacterium]